MKKILLGLIISISCYAAPAYVQATICGGSSPYACAFGSDVTSGNLLVASAIVSGDPVPTVIDSQGNTYTLGVHIVANGIRLYYSVATATGPLTITWTQTGVVNAVVIGEYSGVDASTIDGVCSGGGIAGSNQQRLTNDSPGSFTTTLANDLIVCSGRDYDSTGANPSDGLWSNGDTVTFRTGFHELTALFDTVPGHVMSTVTGYYTAAGSTSSGGCIAFAGSGSPPSTVITRRFIGMGR